MDRDAENDHYERIRSLIKARVRLSVRDDGGTVDDVTALALEDYRQYVAKLQNESSKDVSTDDKNVVRNEVALLTTFASRRVADHFRKSTHQVLFNALQIEDVQEPTSKENGPEEQHSQRSLIMDTLCEISQLPEAHRMLLLRSLEGRVNEVLTTAERKQLSRTRRRLRDRIETRYGCSIKDLLDSDQ